MTWFPDGRQIRGSSPSWLELLREAAPGFSRVGAMVIPPQEATVDGTVIGLQSAAGALGLDVHIVGVRSAAELEGAFAQVVRDRMQALYVSESPLFLVLRRTEFVAKVAGMRVPAIYPFREFAVQTGGLMNPTVPVCPKCIRRASPSTSTKYSKAPDRATCHCT